MWVKKRGGSGAAELPVTVDGYKNFSRFARDPHVYSAIFNRILFGLAKERSTDADRGGSGGAAATVRCWSAGCSSGEEPYTLSLGWECALAPHFPNVALEVVATDRSAKAVGQARRGLFGPHAVSNLPLDWVSRCFRILEPDEPGAHEVTDGLGCVFRDLQGEHPVEELRRARLPRHAHHTKDQSRLWT